MPYAEMDEMKMYVCVFVGGGGLGGGVRAKE